MFSKYLKLETKICIFYLSDKFSQKKKGTDADINVSFHRSWSLYIQHEE